MLKNWVAGHMPESLVCLNGGQLGWCKDFAEDVGRTLLGGGLAVSGSVGGCGSAPGENGPHGERFFFLIRKEPFALTNAVEFRPRVTAETLKACALIGLHMIAGETTRSFSGISPDLGDMWRCDCPKSFDCGSDLDVWAESECTPRHEVYEHTNECVVLLKSLGRTGQASLFFEDWELGRVALCCHMAIDLLCQEMRDACQDSSESQVCTV